VRIFRGAKVVDGTGTPGRAADVVVDGDRIVAVTAAGAAPAGHEVVNLDGLVLAPGFVDCHTHYDAQVLWDRDLTPSGAHGVTTVVMGNCGFGIAPTRPEHRDAIALTLENVEGMAVEALLAGIPWTFETFPEYLDAIERGGTRLNVAVMIGHSPLRLFVMGSDATERTATAEEIATMRRLVGEALDAGAVGFASSQNSVHVGAWGKPVPSRLADASEIMEIGQALAERNRGAVAITRGPSFDLPELSRLSLTTGRPVTWTALVSDAASFGLLDEQRALGGEVWPQVSCRPIVMLLTLSDPGALARAPAFAEILTQAREDRPTLYRDPAWRRRIRADYAELFGSRYDRIFVQETDVHRDLQGRSIAAIAAERNADPLDTWVDLALAEDLRTRFRVVIANDNEQRLGRLLDDERTLLGLSDAGAHASQLCDAVFSTYLLQHWVRETGVLSLEKAIWRLTSHPAEVFGLGGRGRIAPGYFADLVAFDPDVVAPEPTERVFDLPGGADRLVADSRGIEAVWINGQASRLDGKDVPGVRPGTLIRQSN